MKRVLFGILLFAFLAIFSVVLSAGTVSSNEDEPPEKVQSIVDKANAKVEENIEKAVTQSEKVIAKYEAGKISIEEKEAKVQAIIENLVTKTNEITTKAIEKCEKHGAVVECEWVEVIIDGQVVMVDPIRIVGW